MLTSEQLIRKMCAISAHPFTPSSEDKDITSFTKIKEQEAARNVPIPLPYDNWSKTSRNFRGVPKEELTECCQ